MDENLDIFTSGVFSSVAIIDGDRVSGIFDESYSPGYETATVVEGDRITFLIQTIQANKVSHGDSLDFEEREFDERPRAADRRKGTREFEVIGKEKVGDGKMTELVLKELE